MPLKIRERDIEAKVKRYCDSRGLLCYKFSSPSHRGVCDRIIIGPSGTLFLELKAPGEKPTALQQKFLDDVNARKAPRVLGWWADSVEQSKAWIDLWCL